MSAIESRARLLYGIGSIPRKDLKNESDMFRHHFVEVFKDSYGLLFGAPKKDFFITTINLLLDLQEVKF